MQVVGIKRTGPVHRTGNAVESAHADDTAGRRIERAADLALRIVEKNFVGAVRTGEAAGRRRRGARIGVVDLCGGVAVPGIHRGLNFADAATGVAGLRSGAVPLRAAAVVERVPAIHGPLGQERELRLDDAAVHRRLRGRLRDVALEHGVSDAVALHAIAPGNAIGDVRLERGGIALDVLRLHWLQRGIEQLDVARVVVADQEPPSVRGALFAELADEEIDGLVIAARRRRQKRHHTLAGLVHRRSEDLRDAAVDFAADFADG